MLIYQKRKKKMKKMNKKYINIKLLNHTKLEVFCKNFVCYRKIKLFKDYKIGLKISNIIKLI